MVSRLIAGIVFGLFLVIFIVSIEGCYRHDEAGSIADSFDGSINDSDSADDDTIRIGDKSDSDLHDASISDSDTAIAKGSDSDFHDVSISDSDSIDDSIMPVSDRSDDCFTEDSAMVKWTFVGDYELRVPAIGYDGTLFVSSYMYYNSEKPYLYAVDSENGEEIWRFQGERDLPTPANGIDNVLIVPTGRRRHDDEGDNFLYALNPSNGDVIWKIQGPEQPYDTPVIDKDGKIFAPASKFSLDCISESNGELIWRYETDSSLSTPAIGIDGTLFVSLSGEGLHAIDPSNGQQIWNFRTPGLYGGDRGKTPVIGSNGTIYYATEYNGLYAVDPLRGVSIWKVDPRGSIDYRPALGTYGTVFSLAGGQLVAFNPPDKKQIWGFAARNTTSAPTVGIDGTVYINSADNYLYAIDPSDGTPIWRFRAGNWSGGTLGNALEPVIGEDGTIYVLSGGNTLYALDPTLYKRSIPAEEELCRYNTASL